MSIRERIHSATIIPHDQLAVEPEPDQILIVVKPYVGAVIVHDVAVSEDDNHTSYVFTTEIKANSGHVVDMLREFMDENQREYERYINELIETTFV